MTAKLPLITHPLREGIYATRKENNIKNFALQLTSKECKLANRKLLVESLMSLTGERISSSTTSIHCSASASIQKLKFAHSF